MKKLYKNYKIVGEFMLSPAEIQFFIHLSNGETVSSAAESIMVSKRTMENRMYKITNSMGFKNTTQLIAYLLRNNIIE